MIYVDGFLIPLAKTEKENYRNIAEAAGKLWMEHGALAYKECIAEDLDAKDMVSFSKSADAKSDETVVFSYIVYKSREHRDEVNAKVMADPRIHQLCPPDKAPFDCKRMAYGGFESIVDL